MCLPEIGQDNEVEGFQRIRAVAPRFAAVLSKVRRVLSRGESDHVTEIRKYAGDRKTEGFLIGQDRSATARL